MSAVDSNRRLVHRLWLLAWLWLLWLLLWGRASPAVVAGGLVVAVGVLVAFPLPYLLPRTKFRPVALARLAGHLVVDLFVSASVVAWEAVRRGPRTRAAIFEMPMHSGGDFLVTVTASITTLTPGTLVVEIDRRNRLLYVHTLPAPDRSAVEDRRREAEEAKVLVARALAGPGERDGERRRKSDGKGAS